MRGTGHPCGVPPRPTGAAPLPAYRGPQRGPQCAPLRPTACAASPCVSPLRPPSGGNESPSVVRGVGHTGLRPFFPSPLPGAWPLRFSVKGSRFAPKSSPVRCSGLRPCAPLRLPVSPLTLPLRSTAGQPNSRQQAKTARSGVFWPWWYIRQGWGKKTRCRPVSGLSGGICRFHSKWTPVPVFRGQLTTPLGHLATSATGHKRSLAHCEHLSVLAHEKKKPSRAPDVALCLMQGHTLNITFVML